ncbi:butyrophilin subfamily 1 member A1-like isoform 2-T2 [Molossus nigricans]
METVGHCGILLRKNDSGLRESHHEVDVHTTTDAYKSLIWLVFCFIIYIFKKEHYQRETIKKENKEDQDQPKKEYDHLRKENDQLMKDNENLQKEIGERKAQFRNGWQKTSLYPDWRREFFRAENIILDPATAHPALILSEGNRRVTLGEEFQDLPKNPQRFYSLPCVLGHQVISSGRLYWEIEVKDSRAWDLGICRPNVTRKGKISIKPEDGFWAIRFYKNEYWALTSAKTQLILKEHLARLCIFLEYEEGLISFYNMTDKSHIYTFSEGSFDGPLRPFFRLWSSDSGHLTICPVPKEAEPDDNLPHVLTPAQGASYALQVSVD